MDIYSAAGGSLDAEKVCSSWRSSKCCQRSSQLCLKESFSACRPSGLHKAHASAQKLRTPCCLPEGSLLRQLCKPCLAPLVNHRPVVHQNQEEGVQQQHCLRIQALHVQQGRARRLVQGVGDQLRLDHDQTVLHRLSVQQVAEVGSLIRRVAKDLHTPVLSNMEGCSARRQV